MTNEDSPYIWVPEVCQFISDGDCLDKFPESPACLLVSEWAYREMTKERDAYAMAMAMALEHGIFPNKSAVQEAIDKVLKDVRR